MKTNKLAVLLAICFALTACGTASQTAEMKKYSAVRTDMFDTVIMLTGYARNEDAFNESADAVFNELLQMHRLFDVYNEYDGLVNICAINRAAGADALEADRRIIELLMLAREFAEITDGKVDVTSGRVLRLWRDARLASESSPDAAHIPDAEALTKAAAHTGFDRLEIDPNLNTVRITDPETLLDVGAIAKGYAVQRACMDLPAGWLISAGGNVFASGAKTDGSAWTVGIQNPNGDASDILRKVKITRGAVVTSGDYQRYFTLDGVRYHHIIDLETLRPAQKWRSVTIVCDDSGIADALSTALFVMSKEEGQRLLDQYGAAALWVGTDGSVQLSAGMNSYLMP